MIRYKFDNLSLDIPEDNKNQKILSKNQAIRFLYIFKKTIQKGSE